MFVGPPIKTFMETPKHSLLNETEVRRFLCNVCTIEDSNGCWRYTGYIRNTDGYGVFKIRSKGRFRAHRLTYELFVGAIPVGFHVLHRCDNPECCNPKHLFLGTQESNMKDMARKGRGRNQKTGKLMVTIGNDEIRLKIIEREFC